MGTLVFLVFSTALVKSMVVFRVFILYPFLLLPAGRVMLSFFYGDVGSVPDSTCLRLSVVGYNRITCFTFSVRSYSMGGPGIFPDVWARPSSIEGVAITLATSA